MDIEKITFSKQQSEGRDIRGDKIINPTTTSDRSIRRSDREHQWRRAIGNNEDTSWGRRKV